MTEIKPVKIGDAVTINNGGLEFIIVSIELQNNELMACGEYGCFNITLLDQYQAAKNDMLKQAIVKGEAVLASKMKNLCAKTRPTDNPYEIWRSEGWEWRVLKKYKSPENEAKDKYARWFCAVKSPYTHESFELGDVYAAEIKQQAKLVNDENTTSIKS